MANGQGGLAPGLSGFRTQRKDKMQRQQHGMQMAQARQGMAESAQQMRQRRLQIEQMKMQNEEFRRNEELREAQREQGVLEAELGQKQAGYQVENFEELQALEQRQKRIEMMTEQAQAQKYYAEANQASTENRVQANQFIADQLPDDPQQLTQRKLNRLRRSVTAMGQDPDDLGIPSELNDASRARLMNRRRQALNTVEQAQERDMAAYEEAIKPAEDEISRLQQRRRSLMRAYEGLEDTDSEQGRRLQQEISEVNDRIEKNNTLVGRTETDAQFGSDRYQGDMIKEQNIANQGLEKIDEMIQVLNENPLAAGPAGSIAGGVQSLQQQGKDIWNAFLAQDNSPANDLIETASQTYQQDVQAGRVSEELQESNPFNPDYARIQQFENSIAYLTARMRKQGGGKYNVQDLNSARQESRITGFGTSRADALTRLTELRGDFQTFKENVQARSEGRVNPYDPQTQTRGRMQDRDAQVEDERTQLDLGSVARNVYSSTVSNIQQGENGPQATLANGLVINREGRIVDNLNYPDAIRRLGAQNVEREVRYRETGETLYEMNNGELRDRNGNRVEIED